MSEIKRNDVHYSELEVDILNKKRCKLATLCLYSAYICHGDSHKDLTILEIHAKKSYQI